MNTKRVIVDLRRHRSDVSHILKPIAQYVSSLGGATIDWLLRADQNDAVPFGHRLGLADPKDTKWGRVICEHILDVHGRKAQNEEISFWVLSYDNPLLSEATALSLRGLAITPVHFGEFFPVSKAAFLQTPHRAIAGPMPIDEAAALTRSILESGGFVSAARAFPRKDLRPRLAMQDGRAAKRVGDIESESLIREVVSRGVAEGWMCAEQAVPGITGTEIIYLRSQQLSEFADPLSRPETTYPTVPELEQLAAETSALQEIDIRARNRANDFQSIVDGIGGIPSTRELVFDAVEAIVLGPNYSHLLISELTQVSLGDAQAAAVAIGYSLEHKWPAAARCVVRLMLRAGALLDKFGRPIADKIGRDSKRVAAVIPDFRLVCVSYLALEIIRSCTRFDYNEDTYYLGLVLYRAGRAEMLSPAELKEKADQILEYLLQKGLIEQGDDNIIRRVQSKRTLH